MIETIIMDMGNVLINFSYKIAAQQVSKLCQTKPEVLKEFLFDSGLQDSYEAGKYSSAEIFDLFKQNFKANFSLEDLKKAACSMFWPKPEMAELAKTLRDQGYRMLLLSNVCDIHFGFIKENYQFLDYFDHLVLSYQVGCCKPDQEIYHKALALADAPPNKCFFIDDLLENVKAATKIGIVGHHFSEIAELKNTMKTLGIRY